MRTATPANRVAPLRENPDSAGAIRNVQLVDEIDRLANRTGAPGKPRINRATDIEKARTASRRVQPSLSKLFHNGIFPDAVGANT